MWTLVVYCGEERADPKDKTMFTGYRFTFVPALTFGDLRSKTEGRDWMQLDTGYKQLFFESNTTSTTLTLESWVR